MLQSTVIFALRRLSIATVFLLLLGFFSPRQAQAQTWLVSTEAYVRLGVIDKFGQLGAYTAKFVVTHQRTGKTYSLVREIEKGQNGIDVLYPSLATDADYFKADSGEAGPATPGNYVWECQVNGKRVVGGRFTLGEAINDVNFITKQ